MKKRTITVLAMATTIAVLEAGTAQAQVQSASLEMAASSDRVVLGEPVAFTITKTNLLPFDRDWSVRDFLPASMEFASATPSQGSCALLEDSNVVQCDLGTIPSGESASISITATPTLPGKTTNYAADTGENQASTTVVVE